MVKKQYSYLNILKNISTFGVIFYHCFAYLNYGNFANMQSYIVLFFAQLARLAVPIFLFVNGCLLLNKKYTVSKIFGKILKYAILFFICININYFVCVLSGEISFGATTYFASYTLNNGVANYLWFLIALIVIYFLYFPLKRLFDNNKKGFLIITIAVIVVLCSVNMTYFVINIFSHGNVGTLVATLNSILCNQYFAAIVYFMLGGLCFYYKDKIVDCIKHYVFDIVGFLSIVFYFVLCIFVRDYFDIVWNGYISIFSVISVVCIFFAFAAREKDKDFCVTNAVSKQALFVYLAHWSLLKFVKSALVFDKTSVQPILSLIYVLAFAAIMYFVCIIISLLYHNIKKTVLQNSAD